MSGVIYINHKMKGDNRLSKELEDLKKRELTLFHSYNRHGNAQFKLGILRELIEVISKIDVLSKVSS